MLLVFAGRLIITPSDYCSESRGDRRSSPYRGSRQTDLQWWPRIDAVRARIMKLPTHHIAPHDHHADGRPDSRQMLRRGAIQVHSGIADNRSDLIDLADRIQSAL